MLCSHILKAPDWLYKEAFRNDSAIPEVATAKLWSSLIPVRNLQWCSIGPSQCGGPQAKLCAVPPHKTQANATELLLQVQKEVDQKWSLVSVQG